MEKTLTLPRLVDEDAAAAYLGRSVASMQRDRALKQGPRYVKIGRLVRYLVEDLEAYVRANVVETIASVA
jgi:hypothetical protein